MEDSAGNSDILPYEDTTLKLMVDLCSQLADKGLVFEVTLKIKDSFHFSLKSDKKASAQGVGGKRRRGASYRRRQLKRREAFLQKKSVAPPRNAREGGEGVKPLSPPPPPPQSQPPPPPPPPPPFLARRVVTVAGRRRSGTSFLQIDGNADEEEEEEHMSSEEEEGAHSPMTAAVDVPAGADCSPAPLRKIPDDMDTPAKPLLTDKKHTIWTKGGFEVTVFAPKEVPYEDIIEAYMPPTDWRYMRPTSKRFEWVYYPLEED